MYNHVRLMCEENWGKILVMYRIINKLNDVFSFIRDLFNAMIFNYTPQVQPVYIEDER